MIRLVKHGSKSDAYVEKEKKSLNELKGFQLERRLEVYVVSIVLCYRLSFYSLKLVLRLLILVAILVRGSI